MKKEGTSSRDLFKLKIKIIIVSLLAFLVLLTAGRIGLWRVTADYFAPVSGAQAALSFLLGFRFDFYVIVVLAFPFGGQKSRGDLKKSRYFPRIM